MLLLQKLKLSDQIPVGGSSWIKRSFRLQLLFASLVLLICLLYLSSFQIKTHKKPDFCLTFINITKKYLSYVAESPRTIDVPNIQVLRGHNFRSHGNVNFIAKGRNKHQEGMNDLNYKHESPQFKERSSTVNNLIGAFYTIRPRADLHHDLIECTPQWGEKIRTQWCSAWPHPTNHAVDKLGTVPGAQ